MSEQMERNAYRQLLEGITFYIDKVVSDNKEKTTTARIVFVQEDGSYTIDLDGKQYSNINTIGGTCTVNEMVKVMIPQGQYNNMFILKGGSGSDGGSTSGVTSVNGKAGNVVLTASDVGALPNTTVIPTKTSELQNDSNYVVDKDYIHTDNNYTNEDKASVGTIKDKVDKVEGKGLSTNDLTDALKNQYDEAVVDKHTHANKQILDEITAPYTEEEKTKLEGIESGAQKNTVTGVKGNSETAYRTGNINITKENIGLSNVDNVKQWSNNNHPTTLSGYGITDGVDSTDFSNLEQRVNTNEDNIIMLDSDIEGLNTNVGTLQTDMGSVKTAVKTLQDTYVPNTRKVNGKSLDKDISIDKSDVGLGNVENYKSVSVNANQGLTDIEKQNARNNIGAGTGSSDFSGKYEDLTGRPTLGTASSKDVPATGNANVTQVVMGNDTRLTDSRKASDVYPWAKEENKPIYTKDEVGLGNVPNVSTDNQTPTFTQNETLVNIVSGEKLSILFGKISKAISDLISHIANKNNPHEVTKDQVGLGNVGDFKAVSTVENQGLTDVEKANARTNIGAGTSDFSGSYNDLTNKPTTFPPSEHNHDDRYYTESEIDEKLNTKVDNSATGADSLLSKITNSWTSPPTDNTYFIRQDIGGANQFGRVKFSTLWTYIKGKLANVATSGSYNDLSDKPTFLTGGSQTTISTVDSGTNVFTFTRSDGTESTFNVKNGSKGTNGIDGKDGVRGNTWRVGTDLTHAGDTATTTKFTSANTIIGDMYLNTQWQFVYQCIAVTSTDSTWEYLCSIKGGTLAWNSRNVNVASAEQITKSEVDGGENVYRFTLFDGSTSDLVVRNGTGVTIKTTSVAYQTSTSGTAIPTGEWYTDVPSVNKGQYLWSRTIVSYSDDNSTTTYSVAYQGKDGTNATTTDVATTTMNGLMSSTDKVKVDGIWDVVTFTKTLTVQTDWIDTGIAGNNLSNGSYVVQVSDMDASATTLYREIYTGVMSWFGTDTNSTNSCEIILHNAGHADNQADIFLRTSRTPRSDGGSPVLRLQIASNRSNTETTYTFKFRRII